jgi:NodT family efflux transporter outer membrane factor (OMF) lipoprotein
MDTRRAIPADYSIANRLVLLALVASAFAIGGCMVGPDYKPPATTMPATYREPTTGPTTAPASDGASALSVANGAAEIRWWRQLGDPRLTDLVERSITANYSIAVAGARLREARAVRQIAQSLLYPTIGVGASALRYRLSESAVSFQGVNLEDNLFTVGFDAAWVVDVFGGTRRGIEAAKANEQATAAARRGAVLMVAAETARAYLELRGTQRELQIAQQTLEEQRQTLAVTEDKNRNGLASDLEVLRARTEVESTAAQVPPLQQAIRQYIHVLSTLLGLEPTALAAELEPPAPIPAASGQLGVGIPSDLLRRRPDIQTAERQLASATAQVGAATSQLFPQMVLGGSAGLQSRDFDNLFNGNSTNSPSTYYAIGPSINWTVFDAGRRKAGVRFAEAQVDAAKATYQDTVLRAFREVESSLVAVDRATEQVSDLRRLSSTARQSAAIARRDYQRGILDQLTVLDAQRQANRADMLLVQGQVELVLNVVTLYKALGGGWEGAEPSPATQPTQPIAMNRTQGDVR